MKLSRRQSLRLAASAVATSVAASIACAQAYPTRPVRIVVGFAAGGGVDIGARLIGQLLSERLGQTFVVENRPGAASNIATEVVVRAKPDGYTLLMVNPTNAINASLYENLNFNFIRDISAIARTVRIPSIVLVHPSFPATTIPEFISYAKANPRKINMATSGNGSSTHIPGELFKMMTGIDMVNVSYRGTAPAYIDLLGGQVQVMFVAMTSTIEYVTSGKLRGLAVTTTTRSEVFPDIPAVSEFIPGYEFNNWEGLCAPKNTFVDIIEKLNKEINIGLSDPKVKTQLANLGATPFPSLSSDFQTFIASEIERFARIINPDHALGGAFPHVC
jgi:tripartite-type tricarboxylate transporter receptor subunit TctC